MFGVTKSVAIVLTGAALLGLASPALAQRDPAYAAARAQGRVGEQMNGYLGIVGPATPALRAMVDDINIKRKAIYADRAQEKHSTVEEYAFTMGCRNIAQTDAGEKYQAPSGAWQTRDSGEPQRDSRCP